MEKQIERIAAGMRAADKKGGKVIALCYKMGEEPIDITVLGLPIFTAASVQWDDWDTDCEILPLFKSSSLSAERAFMEAYTDLS